MSFSAEIKEELCRVPVSRACCAVAEAYGHLLYANTFSDKEIRIVTENKLVAQRLPPLFQKAFSVKLPLEDGRRKYVYRLTEQAGLHKIFDALGYDNRVYVSYHLNRNVIEEDCCRASFLRGIFLASGAVAGPDKKSHLEIATSHQGLCREVMSLLLDMDLYPKITMRKASGVLYFKDTASIEDFLTLIGSPHAAMRIMEAKVEKELRNSVNRKVNCETANLLKSSGASARQAMALRQVLALGGEDAFPEKLRETARLRLLYPEDSLQELAQRFDPPISKPGLSHRLRKLEEAARIYLEKER